MKWINANEKRPDPKYDKKYVCRDINNKSDTRYLYWNDIPTYFEWLDESESPPLNEGVEEFKNIDEAFDHWAKQYEVPLFSERYAREAFRACVKNYRDGFYYPNGFDYKSEQNEIEEQIDKIDKMLTSQPRSESGLVELRPAVKWFAEIMEAKLKANDHKSGWLNNTPDSLLTRLKEETKELIEVLEWRKRDTGRSAGDGLLVTDVSNEKIINEAADIANFAMMIADLFGSEIGDEKAHTKDQHKEVPGDLG